jgi:predicted Zn-dependent peptidase
MNGRLLLWIVLLSGCARGTIPPSPSDQVMPSLDRSTAPMVRPLPEYSATPVAQHVLSNGLRVWIVERESAPLVEARFVVDAGTAREPAARAGLASLTSALLMEGTAQRSASELAEQLDYLGAELRAGASSDGAVLTMSVLARNAEDAFAIFNDVVQSPAFSDAAFERVRQQRRTALIAAAAQPQTLADQQFAAVIYGRNHPYGRPARGTAAALRNLTNADVVSFYRTFYHPDNAVLIVVGAVRTETLLPMLERMLGSWRAAAVRPVAASLPAPSRPSDSIIYLVDRPGSAQSELRVGHPALPRADSAFAALTLINTVLGGQPGRIWLNLREQKGYAYTTGSVLDARRFAGALRAYAAVQTETTAQALSELMREIRELSTVRPVTEQELESARGRILRNEPFAAETMAQLANRLQGLAMLSLPATAHDTFLQELRQLTRSDLSLALQRSAAPVTVMVVGDRTRIEAPLRELGLPVHIVAVESME